MDLTLIIEIVQTIDTDLKYYVEKYDFWIYMILFSIVYAKTGFVVTTFLPGDTVVFASGTLAAISTLNIWILIPVFFLATILGDNQNYAIGKMVGKMPLEQSIFNRFLSPRLLEQASELLDKYGMTAITFSRFIPLMRTTMPFIAGITKFSHHTFLVCNFTGALLWTTLWLGTGFILGNIQWVKDHLFITLVIITVLAIVPSIVGFVKRYSKAKEELSN